MTTLSENDLKAIKAIVYEQLKPISERINAIDRRLSKLEKQNNIVTISAIVSKFGRRDFRRKKETE